jgi:hypothetical protein
LSSIRPQTNSSSPPFATSWATITGSNPTSTPYHQANDSRHTSKQNFKTEFCKHYLKWRDGGWVEEFKCPYGAKCNFAHGENELTGKVVDNLDTYLRLPCFDHVATGDW